MEGKVIGIGGVFLRFKNPSKIRDWYKDVLGMETNDYGVLFSFNNSSLPKGYIQLGTFPEDTDYFGTAQQQTMINFRVDDMSKLVERLKQHNVKIVNEIQEYEYGKFLHIEDPENNRIELWEPIDSTFGKEVHVEMR